MTRPSSANDFYVDVENIGNFSFAKRTMRDEMKIGAEYSRLTEGVDTPSNWLSVVAGWISSLKVLTVSAPDGWDIDEMDPLDQKTYEQLRDVHNALQEKELSFRQKKIKDIEAKRSANGEVSGVLVPPTVQPSTD